MRLTASALSRAESCIGSVVLPPVREAGTYAASGQAVDDFIRIGKTEGREAALAQAPAEMLRYLAALPLEKIPDGVECQVAFAYNALTGEVRRIPSRSTGYPEDMGEEWIFGSTDLTGMRPGRAFVWDVKWGEYSTGRDPETDLQLGLYAVCAAKLAGVDECETGFARADWKADLVPETTVLDEWQLAAMEERIRGIWREQQKYRPDPLIVLSERASRALPLSVGDHCTYCPARRNCPAQMQPVQLALAGRLTELAGAALPTLDEARERIEALTLVDMGRLYERLDAAADYIAMLKGILREHARVEPLPLAGGKELREVQWGTQKVSPEAQARIEAVKEQCRVEGLIQTIKAPQVRPMKARK